MKIAVVVSTYPPYKGGMGNSARGHAEALKRADHDVTVLAPGLSLRPWLRFGNAALVPQLVWRLRGFDAVLLEYPFHGGAEWVWLWKKLFGRGKRLAVFYHMDNVGSGPLGALFALYRRLFMKRILAAADSVIVMSRDYLSASQARAFAAAAREAPSAVDTGRFRPGARDPETALFVGGLDRAHYFKGLGVLLEAFKDLSGRFPQAKLRIVGDGDLRQAYEKQATDIGIAGRVAFLGAVSDADLPAVYRSAGFHVLPAVDRSEAFGLATLEAASSGLPSIVSDLPGVRTTISAGETGLLVPPGDAKALAEALAVFFGDHEKTARMGAAARIRAERLYAREVADRRLVEAVAG